MKNWNQKTRAEQLFLLSLIFIVAFGLLCVSGCGGSSCETPKCGSGEMDGINAAGCSLPGCGGCITPGRGCNTCLWAQSCKFFSVSGVEENDDDSETEVSFKGCDLRYYDGGCLGCGQQEKSCYSGCIKVNPDSDEESMNGIIYGSSDGSEKYIGCAGGCGGCVDTNGIGWALIRGFEYLIGGQ